jgi:hypothetical protein
MYQICNELKPILSAALAEGNEITNIITTYSGIKAVFHMKRPMSKAIEEKFKHQAGLEYWHYDGSPQNPPDCGFEALHAKEMIVFPLFKES